MASSSVRATPNMRSARQSIARDSPASRRPPPSTASGRSTSSNLPDYESPSFPLNAAAQRALTDILRQSNLTSLVSHINSAQGDLADTAADINERVALKQDASRKRSRRSDVNDGDDDGDEDDEISRGLNELQDSVARMTQRMEESMRKMIDGKHGYDHIKENITAVATDARANATTQASTQGRTQRRTRANEDEGEEEEDEEQMQDFDPTDPTAGTQGQIAPVKLFRTKMEDSRTLYQSHSLAERYSKDENYIKFKQLVHDAQQSDTDLPHPRTWFTEEGDVPGPGVMTGNGDGGDYGDDDIAIARTTISTKCPLTLQEFRDPLSSKKCNHNFEADAFKSLLRSATRRVRRKPVVQCPCASCQQELGMDDLHRDPVIIRKIKRIQRAREIRAEEDDEEGDGLGATQRDATMIDDEDEDENGADVDALLERQTQMKTEPRGTARPAGVPAIIGASRSTAPIELGNGSDEDEESAVEDDVSVDGPAILLAMHKAAIDMRTDDKKPRARNSNAASELRQRITKLEALGQQLPGVQTLSTEQSKAVHAVETQSNGTSAQTSQALAAAGETNQYVAGSFWTILASEVKALAEVLHQDTGDQDGDGTLDHASTPLDSGTSMETIPEQSGNATGESFLFGVVTPTGSSGSLPVLDSTVERTLFAT
ncbi:hypothetical protein LTR62_003598 [Meristemomyces frigidus]|uniref:SP-RING-type domain-containing protein n=1 Tax=Meristemomyces frigidus TaxID=1508187 RepID=A0AAN7TK74_9PEZI|nr:hypothetical protein LTR62_003598 [Meristemomyces frigidus]